MFAVQFVFHMPVHSAELILTEHVLVLSYYRDFKRYFYNNIVTGETSWRYPEVGGDEEKSCRDPGTSNAFKEDTETIMKSSVIAGFNPTLQVHNAIIRYICHNKSGIKY